MMMDTKGGGGGEKLGTRGGVGRQAEEDAEDFDEEEKEKQKRRRMRMRRRVNGVTRI